MGVCECVCMCVCVWGGYYVQVCSNSRSHAATFVQTVRPRKPAGEAHAPVDNPAGRANSVVKHGIPESRWSCRCWRRCGLGVAAESETGVNNAEV
jgi:hypothetical protein